MSWLNDYYNQTRKISGKILSDGRIEFFDLMDWEDRRLHRTDKKTGQLKGMFFEEPKNPVLIREPSNMSLSNKAFRDNVKRYAQEFRARAKSATQRQGFRDDERFN